MLGIKALVFGGGIALVAFGSISFLAFKYHGDLIEATIENKQLTQEVSELEKEKELLAKLNQQRLEGTVTSLEGVRRDVEEINRVEDDGCLDRNVPDAVANRLFPEEE